MHDERHRYLRPRAHAGVSVDDDARHAACAAPARQPSRDPHAPARLRAASRDCHAAPRAARPPRTLVALQPIRVRERDGCDENKQHQSKLTRHTRVARRAARTLLCARLRRTAEEAPEEFEVLPVEDVAPAARDTTRTRTQHTPITERPTPFTKSASSPPTSNRIKSIKSNQIKSNQMHQFANATHLTQNSMFSLQISENTSGGTAARFALCARAA